MKYHLLWTLYDNFEKSNQPISKMPTTEDPYRQVSEFSGKTPDEVSDLFSKHHLKAGDLPNPPDSNVKAFLEDPAFSGVDRTALLYLIYGWS